MSALRIRAATPADAEAIARVHVRAWRETYPGIIPQAFLDALSVDDRKHLWDHLLTLPGDARVTLVVEDAGAIVGFADGGPARSEELGTEAEVGAVYLLDIAKGRGIGRDLFAAIRDALRQRGYGSIGLWVATENARAVRFYEAAGGVVGARRDEFVGVVAVPHTAYFWRARS